MSLKKVQKDWRVANPLLFEIEQSVATLHHVGPSTSTKLITKQHFL
ncbi:hypothetical protein [Vibrio methylphosphonaticus]|nr:hypothetical protein [Vibrio methylphosphonaticus]MCL9774214.1 hypothetical protein [Vibrio methylphosphonaticus]